MSKVRSGSCIPQDTQHRWGTRSGRSAASCTESREDHGAPRKRHSQRVRRVEPRGVGDALTHGWGVGDLPERTLDTLH